MTGVENVRSGFDFYFTCGLVLVVWIGRSELCKTGWDVLSCVDRVGYKLSVNLSFSLSVVSSCYPIV